MVKKLALCTHTAYNLLDHLGPLAYALNMPLLVTEESNMRLIERYYPMIKAILVDVEKLSCEKLVDNYDMIFQSVFYDVNLIQYFAEMKNKKICFTWAPHGNSDKGYKEPVLERILDQDIVLLYGDHMINRLKKQQLFDKIPPYILTGNYRLSFFQKFRNFYQKTINNEIFSKLNPQNPTILYAPTWNDVENLTSFFNQAKKVIENLPSHYNLIVKAHPLLAEKDPAKYYASFPSRENDNVLMLEDFPPIYPLLANVDIYLGDFSSVGYDFLHFNKPMFFFKSSDSIEEGFLYLHQAGITIPNNCKDLYGFIDEKVTNWDPELSKKQRDIYNFAFGEPKDFKQLENEIDEAFVKQLYNAPTLGITKTDVSS